MAAIRARSALEGPESARSSKAPTAVGVQPTFELALALTWLPERSGVPLAVTALIRLAGQVVVWRATISKVAKSP